MGLAFFIHHYIQSFLPPLYHQLHILPLVLLPPFLPRVIHLHTSPALLLQGLTLLILLLHLPPPPPPLPL